MIDRRHFLGTLARLGLGAGFAPLVRELLEASARAAEAGLHPARYWHARGDKVACELCPR